MSEDYKKEIDRLIKAAGVKAVNRISEPIRVEDAFQPKRRKTLKETIKVIADTPEEAQAFMALLQNAGIEQEMPQGDEMEPSDELPQPQGDELPQDGGPPCGMEAEAEGEIAQGADYANSPDEEYEDDPMNTYSTKWNHQKKFRRTNNHGDNPLSLADSLMREWTDVRDTEEIEEVIKSADAIPRMVDKDDNPIDGKGPVGPGDIIQRPEVFDPVWGDWGHTPESWSDEQVDAYAEEIIAISKGQDPKIEGFDSYFDALGDGRPVDVEGGKYDADDIMDIINDTIGGQMNSVIGEFLELYMNKPTGTNPKLPSPELQKDALGIVRHPEFKKSLARVRSGQQKQVGEAIGGEWSRNTPPALMAVIKKHNIDPYDAKQMANEDFLGEVDMAADYHGAYLDRIAKEGKIKPDENGQFFFSDEEEELHDIDGGEMWHDSPEGEKFFGIIDELCQAMGINQEYKIQVEECGNALMKYVEDSATEERQVGEDRDDSKLSVDSLRRAMHRSEAGAKKAREEGDLSMGDLFDREAGMYQAKLDKALERQRKVGEDEAMAQYSPNLPKDKKTKEDVINEMGDAETELLPGVKDEDNILIVQRGDNADDIDEDPRVTGELFASEKHSDDDIKKAIADYLKSKNLDTNFYYDSTPNDYYSKEKTVDGRPFRAEVSLHWLGNMGEQEQVGDEGLNRIKELSGIDKQVGEEELKRYGNYRRRN